MFGIIRPCRHRLSSELRTSWLAHLCGLCLALRDDHGQFARVVTNYDGLVISALVEAQSTMDPGARRLAGPCPLRGMRTAEVSQGDGARLAATVSLVLASAKVRDHVVDGDGVFGRRPVAGMARKVAGRWARQSARVGEQVGFDTGVLLAAAERQSEVESEVRRGMSVLVATEPTEVATAAAFAHTAELSGVSTVVRGRNAVALSEVGRLFGRVAHLLDAVEDLEDDERAGAWNPIAATGTGLAEVRRLCDDAVLGVRLALEEVTFSDRALVHALLVHELEAAVSRTFGHAGGENHDHGHRDGRGAGGGLWVPRIRNSSRRRGALAGCAVALYMCCSCQFCCRDPFPGPWSGEPRSNQCRDACTCGGDGGCCDGRKDGCCDCCCCDC